MYCNLFKISECWTVKSCLPLWHYTQCCSSHIHLSPRVKQLLQALSCLDTCPSGDGFCLSSPCHSPDDALLTNRQLFLYRFHSRAPGPYSQVRITTHFYCLNITRGDARIPSDEGPFLPWRSSSLACFAIMVRKWACCPAVYRLQSNFPASDWAEAFSKMRHWSGLSVLKISQ